MTIDQVFRTVKFEANKFGYYLAPDEFNLIWPQKELQYFTKEYVQYGLTQKVSDSLSKFLILLPITIDAAGKYALPSNLLHVDSVSHLVNNIPVPVKRVEKDRVAGNLSSTYDAPTLEFPIYTQYAAYLQFYPVNIATANLVYLFQPVASKWGYTLVNNRPKYDAANSVDPLWLDTDINNIIYLLLQDIAIKNRDQELEQFGMVQEKSKI